MHITDSMFTRSGRLGLTAIDRFWKYVDKNGPTQPHMAAPCWLWTGATNNGYGSLCVGGKPLGAHRITFLIVAGKIDDNLSACHKCDFPTCVNPEHIFLGTTGDNMRDRTAKGRCASGVANGRHTMPERTAYGDRNGSRLHPEKRSYGADNHKTVLNPEQVRAVRAMLAEDVHTISHIARTFSVDRSAIYGIKSGKNWKHVT